MDIPREQEEQATSEQEELKAIDSREKDEDSTPVGTRSSLSEKSDITRVPAGKSTSPKTQRGKEHSKHNALKHGIFSQVVLLKEDPRAEYDSLLYGFRVDLEPEGKLEEFLVDKLAATVWRQRRLIIAEKEQTTKKMDYFAIVPDGDGAPRLDLLMRYESNLERAFDRTLNHLERLRRIRRGEVVLPALDVNVST